MKTVLFKIIKPVLFLRKQYEFKVEYTTSKVFTTIYY